MGKRFMYKFILEMKSANKIHVFINLVNSLNDYICVDKKNESYKKGFEDIHPTLTTTSDKISVASTFHKEIIASNEIGIYFDMISIFIINKNSTNIQEIIVTNDAVDSKDIKYIIKRIKEYLKENKIAYTYEKIDNKGKIN